VKLVDVGVNSLIENPSNSRHHPEAQIIQLVKSIKEFGFTSPILIDEDGVIIAGHGRLAAAKASSMATVPCIELAGLTEAQKKAYLVADNQLGLTSSWDYEALTSSLESLGDDGFSIDLLGFDDDFLSEIIPDDAELTVEHAEPEPKDSFEQPEKKGTFFPLVLALTKKQHDDLKAAVKESGGTTENFIMELL